VKFNVIKTNVNRRTQVYLSSCPCKYLFTLINSTTFVLDNIKTTTPLDMAGKIQSLDEFIVNWVSAELEACGATKDKIHQFVTVENYTGTF
jgi:hypothetical protein